MTAYYRLGARLEVSLRSDIFSDLDVMILEAYREGDSVTPARLINIYNQKQLGEPNSITYTVDHLASIYLNPAIPTIITRDWNTRHPDWDDGIDHPTPRS